MAVSNSGRSEKGLGGNSSVGEITVNVSDLHSLSEQMMQVASGLKGRSLNPSFSFSSGQMISELENYAVKLKSYGDNIAIMIETIAAALGKAADTFEKTDSKIGSEILKGNGK